MASRRSCCRWSDVLLVPLPAVWARDEEGAEAGDGAPAGDDSDFSDLELEDIAAVKLRARTPPWQKVENSQW